MEQGQVKLPGGIRTELLGTPEGRILATGIGLALLVLLALALGWLWLPEQFQLLAGLTATGSLFGRIAALCFGYAVGLEQSVVVIITMLIETIFVLIFYPLFVFAWRQLLVLRSLKKFIERTNRAAEAHQETIRKYGVLGLFIFVWFPFWLTGPVVGAAIGFLLGLRTWVTLSVVLSGTYLAIVCWAILLRRVHDLAVAYSAIAPMALVVVLIVVAVLAQVLYDARQENNARKRRR